MDKIFANLVSLLMKIYFDENVLIFAPSTMHTDTLSRCWKCNDPKPSETNPHFGWDEFKYVFQFFNLIYFFFLFVIFGCGHETLWDPIINKIQLPLQNHPNCSWTLTTSLFTTTGFPANADSALVIDRVFHLTPWEVWGPWGNVGSKNMYVLQKTNRTGRGCLKSHMQDIWVHPILWAKYNPPKA